MTKEEYAAELTRFNSMVNAMIQGIIDYDNPDFLALKQKLRDNFKIEFIDLF